MKKFLKITLPIISLSLFIFTCGQSQFDRYKETFHELTIDEKSRKFKGNEGDVNDLKGCGVLFDEQWIYNIRWNDWSPRKEWFDGRIIHSTGVAFNPSKNINMVLKSPLLHQIYIGPWRPITLTKPIPASFTLAHLFASKEQTEADLIKSGLKQQKLIRFFAYYPKEGGNITYQYESQTPENKSISEKPFSLSPSAKIAPDRFGLCVVKWTAKFGYNAVADLHKNPWWPFFSSKYLVGSGKIIDSETGKIIEAKE